MMLNLLYPTRRRISEIDVINWAKDLMIDYACDDLHREDGGQLTDTEYQVIANAVMLKPVTVEEAMHLLEDAGKATFAKIRG